jgi:hypothetical protein
MLVDPTIIGISIGGVALLIIVMVATGSSFLSVVVVITLLGILVYLLNLLGVITISDKNNQLDIKFLESGPAPAPTKAVLTNDVKGAPTQAKEVFYISGNYYTYEDAPAVCAAYDAELASYDQVMQAYSAGAEWCGYGWTQGGMALFPTQESTWSTLMQEVDQKNRTQCGRPGVNGGYFNPNTKFGVNCFGVKPGDKGTQYPTPIPGTDTNSFNKLVQKYKSMINRIVVSPFNRMGWSEWGFSSHAPEVNTPLTVNK